MPRMLIAVTLTWLLGGCGGDSTSSPDGAPAADAGPDATPADAMPLDPGDCPKSYGPGTIIDTFALAPDETTAFDLDGDGTRDNVLAPTSGLINGAFADSIAAGTFRLLLELRGLDDDTLGADPMLDIVTYSAVDEDAPANPDDDFGGDEPFWFSQSSVHAEDCSPQSLLPGVLEDGVLTGDAESMLVPISGFGIVPVGKLNFEASAAPGDTTGWQVAGGRLGGAIPTCTLEEITGSPIGDNYLHALAGFLDLQPDIDLDGDGIEVINAGASGITSCTDGDGTDIPGETCGCDPRIVDGYSALFQFTAVGATVDGPAPQP